MRTRSLPTDTRQSLSLIHILQYLRIIDKKSEVIERKLHQSQKNEELIELLELEKSLVYFTTSLRSNEVVLEKLLRTDLPELDITDEQAVWNFVREKEIDTIVNCAAYTCRFCLRGDKRWKNA